MGVVGGVGVGDCLESGEGVYFLELAMRQIIKVRTVGGCLVITLPKLILEVFQVKEGDRLMISATNSRLVVKKEKT